MWPYEVHLFGCLESPCESFHIQGLLSRRARLDARAGGLRPSSLAPTEPQHFLLLLVQEKEAMLWQERAVWQSRLVIRTTYVF